MDSKDSKDSKDTGNCKYFEGTAKERLIEFLLRNRGRAFTAKELCDVLELESEAEVYALLKQAAKVLKRKGFTLAFSQPVCRKCGFTLNKMDAGKCPKCGSHWIEASRFTVL